MTLITIAMHRAPDYATVKDYANDAVNNFKEHENIALDYSIASLKYIDEVLLDWKNQGAPVSQINKSLFAMASYAGETVLRHLPGRWQAQPEVSTRMQQAFMWIQFENGVIWRPIYQVFALMLAPAALSQTQTLQASLEFALSGSRTPASANAGYSAVSEDQLFADYRLRFVLSDEEMQLPEDTMLNRSADLSARATFTATKPAPQKKTVESGFIASTLVHTQNGLVPIEQIKVGDLVLAKPQQGGELAYKRVVKTIAYESKRIMEITYRIPQTNKVGFLWATPNHRFYLTKDGWTVCERLEHTEHPIFLNHVSTEIKISSVQNIYVTDQADIGWMPKYETMLDDWGDIRRFSPPAMPEYLPGRVSAITEILDGSLDDPYFKQPVYNLELEDSETYFVGELGIWVA